MADLPECGSSSHEQRLPRVPGLTAYDPFNPPPWPSAMAMRSGGDVLDAHSCGSAGSPLLTVNGVDPPATLKVPARTTQLLRIQTQQAAPSSTYGCAMLPESRYRSTSLDATGSRYPATTRIRSRNIFHRTACFWGRRTARIFYSPCRQEKQSSSTPIGTAWLPSTRYLRNTICLPSRVRLRGNLTLW